MHAEVIAIGDELTSGQRVDTNSAWLSQQLADLGVRVLYHTTVADEIEAIAATYRMAHERADVVVSTGGLGPTADDLARQGLAAAVGQPLQMNSRVLDHIRDLFARRGRSMPAQNEIQAMFPSQSHVVDNPHGTAPGIYLEASTPRGPVSHTFALPGVPAEMRQMWSESVQSRLRAIGAGERVIRHRRIKCFGIGESALEQMLPDLIRRSRTPQVGITVHKATITLRITAAGDGSQTIDAAIQPTVETIHRCLGDLVFGEEDDELQHAVIRQLIAQRATLATAEWGTDGVIAQWLRGVHGSEAVYHGGLVAPSWATYARLLGMDQLAIHSLSEVPEDGTRAVAVRLREVMQTDYALATGPRTGPDPPEKASAAVPIVVAAPGGAVSMDLHSLAGHPDIVLHRSAKQALNCLRLRLNRLETGD